MKRFISIKAVRAVGILMLMLTLSVLSQAQPPPVPCCTDFDDSDFHGYHGIKADVFLRTPGPSGDPGDFYLHGIDGSGGSAIYGGPDCFGDWTGIAASGCGALWCDVKMFNDACTPGIPTCDLQGWYPCTLYVVIWSGDPPDRVRAVFRVTSPPYITDDDGDNPGWHHVCLPIELESGGILPSNSYGHWEMGDGAPASQFNGILDDVTGFYLKIEFVPNPAEEVGYDNICLRADCGTIPTLTEWGLIIFGLVLLGFITWVFLRRRKVVGVRT